jgi:hypothetical protein
MQPHLRAIEHQLPWPLQDPAGAWCLGVCCQCLAHDAVHGALHGTLHLKQPALHSTWQQTASPASCQQTRALLCTCWQFVLRLRLLHGQLAAGMAAANWPACQILLLCCTQELHYGS